MKKGSIMKSTTLEHGSEKDTKEEELASTLKNLSLNTRNGGNEEDLVNLTSQLNIESKKDQEDAESDEDNEDTEEDHKAEKNELDEIKVSNKYSKKEDEKRANTAEDKENNIELREKGELKERGPMRNQPVGQHRAHPYNQETSINYPFDSLNDYSTYSDPESPGSISSLSGPSTPGAPTSPQQEVPDVQVRNALQNTQQIDHFARLTIQSPSCQDVNNDLVTEDGLNRSYVEYMKDNMDNPEVIENFRRDFRESRDKVYNTDADGDTTLMCLIANEYPLEAIFALVEMISEEKPQFINLANTKSQTALYTAVYYNRWCLAGYLIERGADPNLPTNKRGDTSLHFACRKGYMKSVKALLTALPGETGYQLDVNKPNNLEETPLEIALKYPNIAREEIVQLLVRHGARPEVEHSGVGMHGRPVYKSLMRFLIKNQELDLMRICLENSRESMKLARLVYSNVDQTSLLHYVVTDDKMNVKTKAEFLNLLMFFGADPNVRDYMGNRPVDYLTSDDIELGRYIYPANG